MKRWLKWLLLVGALLTVVVTGLGYLFIDELRREARRYMHRETDRSIDRYGRNLGPIDTVRLLRLDTLVKNASAPRFRVSYSSDQKMAVARDKILSGSEAQEFARLWRGLRLHTDYMAACYSPHHVVQFLNRRSLVCEAVICFECGNTTLPAFPMKALVSFESMPYSVSAGYRKFRSTVETAVGGHGD